ncbi:HNH endonuclease [Brevundimonas sp. KM4]|uniref:HNH endonuclease n=1 Tax=Brevundimonas sp. KM4 TaxID=1628191 RepID=UPI0005F76964|nr:hypothetical protein [Brevundimonas sp. KM4]KJV40895.1 hypothetical protein VH88_11190 [Brevundimonas sp. KM4]
MADWPYTTARWQRLRKAKLSEAPLCETCERRGRKVVAEHVDHVVAIKQGGPAFPAKGDVQARFEAYRIGREIGALSPNDIRRRENESPIAGGDVYHQPANWVALGSAPEAANG